MAILHIGRDLLSLHTMGRGQDPARSDDDATAEVVISLPSPKPYRHLQAQRRTKNVGDNWTYLWLIYILASFHHQRRNVLMHARNKQITNESTIYRTYSLCSRQ